jgi:hypothetical protein
MKTHPSVPPDFYRERGDVEAAAFVVYRQTSVSSMKSDDKKIVP